MKILYITFVMGMVSYAQAYEHPCAPLAVNVQEATGVQRTGNDQANQAFEMSIYLRNKKTAFYTSHASPSTVEGANQFCTAPTHGSVCAGVEYVRLLKGEYPPNRPDLMKGVTFDSTFVGYDDQGNTAVEYTLTYAGTARNDYIFKWVDGTPIPANKIDKDDPNKKTAIEVPAKVLEVLKTEFALNAIKIAGYALYVTCDGKYAWVAHKKSDAAKAPASVPELNAAIEKLKTVVKQERNVDVVVMEIRTTFPDKLAQYIDTLAGPPPS